MRTLEELKVALDCTFETCSWFNPFEPGAPSKLSTDMELPIHYGPLCHAVHLFAHSLPESLRLLSVYEQTVRQLMDASGDTWLSDTWLEALTAARALRERMQVGGRPCVRLHLTHAPSGGFAIRA
jgi:hypothetical protein